MLSKRVIGFLVLLAILVSAFNVTVFASFPSGTTKCYTICATGNATTYVDSSLKTVSGYVSRATDEVWITQISGDRAYISYPVAKGRKSAWIPLYELAYNLSGSQSNFVANNQITTYQRNTLATPYGYISKGDSVMLVFNDGKAAQVIYPASGNYKMAWIKASGITTYNQNQTRIVSAPSPQVYNIITHVPVIDPLLYINFSVTNSNFHHADVYIKTSTNENTPALWYKRGLTLSPGTSGISTTLGITRSPFYDKFYYIGVVLYDSNGNVINKEFSSFWVDATGLG